MSATAGKVRGRLSTKQVNSHKQDPREISIEATADNSLVPILYGSRPIPGMNSLWGLDGSGNSIWRVFWCAGEIFDVGTIFYNGKPLPASAEVRNYRGTDIQGVDDLVASIVTVTGYADDMILLKPAGRFAMSYSVIKLAPGAITEAPRWQAIPRGRLVYDVREADGSGDPFNSGDNLLVGYDLQFIGANATTPASGMDISGNAHTVTWVGNAQIQGNELELDGNGDYLILSDDANADFGTGAWTFEVPIEPDTVTGTHHIMSKGDGASNRAIRVVQSANDVLVYMSSNGSSWGIASGVQIGTNCLVANTPAKLTIEYTGREYHFYIDGTHTYQIASSAALFAATTGLWLGHSEGATATDGFDGTIGGCRLTKTVNRYGGVHVATASPYADSDSMNPGYVYNNISIMAAAELAMNPFYGFGMSSVSNLLACITWNEMLLGGAVERARLDLVISGARATEEWLDLLVGSYADCVWYFEGSDITFLPDRPVDAQNPQGWEMGDNGEFITDVADWVLGTGWTHDATFDRLVKTAGVASLATQPMTKPFEAGETYVATLDLTTVTGGSSGLALGFVQMIAYQNTAGRYTYEFVATGAEDGLEIKLGGSSTFVGTVNEASIKRKYWYEDCLVAGSLNIQALSNSDSPTRVIVQHKTPDDDNPNWLDAEPAVAEVPGVEDGTIPLIETRLSLDGLTRTPEANNKAQAKRNRMQNRVRASWISTDIGIAYHKGKVIDVYDPETQARFLVFLEGVGSTIEAGRYRCVGMLYSDLHYPDDLVLPGNAGIVPVGAIGMLRSTTVPSGWSLYNTANTKFIKGAGDTIAPGDTGGATTHAALSGNTVDAGAHGASEVKFHTESYLALTGSGSGYLYTDTDDVQGDHHHTYNTGTITPDVYRRENILVQKITSVGIIVPADVAAFGQGGLAYPNMTRWLAGAQRLLKAATGSINAGNNNQTLLLTTGSTDDSHDHWSRITISNGYPDFIGFTPPWYEPASAGGAHTHLATLALSKALKRIRLAAYVGTDDYEVGPGLCWLWEGSYASIHEDYSLCNGKLGTFDVEDYFLEIAAMGEEGTVAGNNTIAVSGNTNYSAAHDHDNARHDAYTHSTVQISHADNVKHRHPISNSASWEPPYYALALIMYNPNPTTGFIDVALLISGGAANGSTTILDDSNDNLTATVQGAGSLAYSNAQLLFGLTTLLNAGKRIKYAAFDYGKKFTFEGSFRNSSTGAMILFGNHIAADNNTFEVRKNASGDIDLYIGDTIQATIALGLTSGAWFYVGVAYDYAEWRLYAGLYSVGTAVRATYTDAANPVTDDLYWLDGLGGVAAFAGHAAQLRVTRGAAILSGSVVAIPSVAFATA